MADTQSFELRLRVHVRTQDYSPLDMTPGEGPKKVIHGVLPKQKEVENLAASLLLKPPADSTDLGWGVYNVTVLVAPPGVESSDRRRDDV
jgi:hypothetical protein